MRIMGIFGENVVGFDKIGYQRKEIVISSFAEYLGPDAVSYSTDTQVGRLVATEKPLDVALSEKGYFQVINEDGSIELTRDGRFHINKDGELLTQTNQKVLSATGLPIILPNIPESLDKISIGLDGKIAVFDAKNRNYTTAGMIGVVDEDRAVINPNFVRQGYVESSNVALHKEYIEVADYAKSFQANSQMFRLQNSKLSKAISSLGEP